MKEAITRGPVCVVVSAVAAFALASATPRIADAGEKSQCIVAAEQGQQLRDADRYGLANDAFSRCARESCPGVVRQRCEQWLEDLRVEGPTIVLAARDDRGNDLMMVRAFVDEMPFASTLDGRPLLIDPGDHEVRLEAKGFVSIQEHVTMHVKEKNRVLSVQFKKRTADAIEPMRQNVEAPHGAGAAETKVGRDAAMPSGMFEHPIAMWLFALSSLALGGDVYFGLTGMSERNADRGPGGCAPHCSSADRSSIQTKFAIADVSLGVGLLSAGIASYLILAHPGRPPPAAPAPVSFAPRAGGGVIAINGRY